MLVPLSGLKKAAKAADGKMNDAYIAGTLGGLHRYHERHGYDVAATAHQHAGQPPGGNRQGRRQPDEPAAVRVPANIADPVARMHEVHRLVQAWRDEPANPHVQKLAAVFRGCPRT